MRKRKWCASPSEVAEAIRDARFISMIDSARMEQLRPEYGRATCAALLLEVAVEGLSSSGGVVAHQGHFSINAAHETLTGRKLWQHERGADDINLMQIAEAAGWEG